jgi:hypothetical protein
MSLTTIALTPFLFRSLHEMAAKVLHATTGQIINFVTALSTLVIAIFAVIQAIAAKQTARAAKLNAEVLIESQRPHISASPHGDVPSDLMSETPRLQMALTNEGITPALDLRYESWIEVLPQPFEDFTESADHHACIESMVLYPNANPVIVNIPIRDGLSNAQKDDIRKLRKAVCVRVEVTYRDSFSTARRWANFGFFVQPPGLAYLPKYNDAG